MKLRADMQVINQMEPTINDALKAILGSTCFVKTKVLQPLWSGYGEIARFQCEETARSVILKMVKPPVLREHPRGWNTPLSHQRKLSSYNNERQFYQHYAGLTNNECRVPAYLGSGIDGQVSWLLMEDLDSCGYAQRYERVDIAQATNGLRWLAYFHACFMQHSCEQVWPVGTYWHLKTRPDEWHKMRSGSLKDNADKIDHRLNTAVYQTLVHGDAKLANFCFADKGDDDLAAVDFQYVGKGVGIKDVVYFMGSCFNQEELFLHENTLLNHYFSYLTQALQTFKPGIDSALIEQEWRRLYAFAWADFERFLLGWATEHHKLNRYSNQQTELALSQLT